MIYFHPLKPKTLTNSDAESDAVNLPELSYRRDELKCEAIVERL